MGALRRKRSRPPASANSVGIFCAAVGLIILIGGYNYPDNWWLKEFVFNVYPNSGADMLGAALVILLIDRLARQRDDQERRTQLVRELGSVDHAVANRALLELQARGWLMDGTLADAPLAGANLGTATLEGANLTGANLVGAQLSRANLSRSVLVDALLGGADLSDAVLEWAVLTGATLNSANLRRADAAGVQLQRESRLRGPGQRRPAQSESDDGESEAGELVWDEPVGGCAGQCRSGRGAPRLGHAVA